MGVKSLEENHVDNSRKFYKEFYITNYLNRIENNICQKKKQALLTLSQKVFKESWTSNVKIPTNWFNLYIQCYVCIGVIYDKVKA